MSLESSPGLRDKKEDEIPIRLILKQGKGEQEGQTFVAEFYPGQRVLQVMWGSRKSPEDFKIIAEKWLGRIDWELTEKGDLKGKVGKAASVWLRPRIITAGVELNLSGSENVEDSLEKLTEIASKTVMDGVSLSEDLQVQLMKNVSSSPKSPKQPPL